MDEAMTNILLETVLTMNHKLHDNIDWFACGTDSEQLDQIGMRQQFHVLCLTKKLNLERKKSITYRDY